MFLRVTNISAKLAEHPQINAYKKYIVFILHNFLFIQKINESLRFSLPSFLFDIIVSSPLSLANLKLFLLKLCTIY